MKALVTGGAGTLASNLVGRLIQDGLEVVVIDNLSSGYKENVHPKAEFILGDISDEATMLSLLKEHKFDYVFHFAAFFANQNSVEHPLRDLEVNGKGTLLLMKLLNEHSTFLRRFVYASSSCVYGAFEGIADESAPHLLETPYAITKLLGEQYAMYFYKNFGLPVTVYRFFNCYGPGEKPGKYRNVIPNFIHSALNGEPLKITGSGEETRDFTFVDDAVSGILLTLNSEYSIGETYNISTGKETPILHLAERIIELTQSKSKIEFVPRRSWDHTLKRCGDSGKIKKEFGFLARIDLDEGLTKTIEWMKSVYNFNKIKKIADE